MKFSKEKENSILMYKRASIFLIRKYDKWHLFEETLREKFPKFKEGETLSNPEPSYILI